MAPINGPAESFPLPPPAGSSMATQPDFDGPNPGLHSSSSEPSTCPFCRIAAVFPPYEPSSPPPPDAATIRPDATSPDPSTFVVLSTPLLVAFLDIMPLSTGHVLLCPRAHRPKLTDATPEEARELGEHLRLLSAGLARATGVEDWNVVQNNGAAAAQVVLHMHFHIIPRPALRAQGQGRERFTATMFGRGQREDLDEEEAARLAADIRTAVAEMLAEEGKAKL